MKITFQLFSIVCALVIPSAADPEAPEKATKTAALVFLSKAEVSKLIADRSAAGKTCVFGSRDGKSYGMDSDSEISLQPEGKAIVGEAGYTYQGYRGSYGLEEDGTIVLTLKGHRGKWPEMKMAKSGDVVRLYAKDGDNGFVIGGRSGAVETNEMKPFWPFRLVDADSLPSVTPVWTGGDVRTFTSPSLPQDFKWQGEKISFRVDFKLSPQGVPTVEKYWTHDVVPSNQYAEGDWRLAAVKSASDALASWRFYPHKSDDNAVAMGGRSWNFTLSRVGDMVRWKVEDDVVTVFDNMPREPNE
jgi:hypothetical protein